MIFRLLGVNWTVAGTIKEELGAWTGFGKKKKKLTRLIPLTVFWIVWKETNGRMFEETENNILRLETDGSTYLVR